MTLKKYKEKRDFKKTPEPKGKLIRKKKSTLLYIIQKHAASHLHYDFRLELNGVLLSWAVPKGPSLDPSVKRLAMHVEDHPIEYGSFQGIIPKGQYGGGTVMLWDKGEWFPEDEDPVAAYQKGTLKFRLKGEKLKGLWKLFRINKDDKTWLLLKANDEYANSSKKYDITIKEPNSVLTHQTMDEIAENQAATWGKEGVKKTLKSKNPKNQSAETDIEFKPSPFPNEFSPQLATLVDKPPEGKNWLHEIKLDGYRILAFKKNNKTKLMTRNNNDWTHKFKKIAEAVNKLPIKNAIIDGEIVVLDKNQKSVFQDLQNAIKSEDDNQFIYYVFDLLYYDKYNLTKLPLLERKKFLKEILSSPNDLIRYSDHIQGSGKEIFSKSCDLTLEGIVSKDATSEYIQKRSKTWLKVKCIKRQEFVIGGFTKPQGARNHFGALLLGTYNDENELVYNGNVGTGFSAETLKTLNSLLSKNIINKNPFNSIPPKIKNITWVKPKLVAEIEFTEWTKDGSLRHPSFKGLRSDKKPTTITREKETPVDKIVKKSIKKSTPDKQAPSSYKLTHPDKILYPEDKITKKDLAEYYDNIHAWILPYVTNRPLTLVRCPENYNDCFYQKHITTSVPDSLYSISIQEKEGKAECIYIKNKEGLLALPQLGVLEIHTWGSNIKKVECPDMIVFDLDPSPDVTWKEVVKAAFDIRENLAEFKLTSFVKTTGGKGLHVVIPIKPEYDWDEVKNFAHTFVNFLVLNNPKKYIAKMSKVERVGKIFVDYIRNQRGATAIAPYSTRARLHAPVATPIEWDELSNKREDTFFTIKTLPQRLSDLKKDPWEKFFKIKQSINLKKFK